MEEEQKQPVNAELVTTGAQGLPDTTDDIIASAERRISQIDKIVTLTLKRTNEHDWVDMQGKPYLTASGAEKIARLFGMSWKLEQPNKIQSSDEKGTFYFYEVAGIFSLAGKNDIIEAIGTCSSKDQFFAKVGGQFRPLSEIDETNILKAAISNCIANGITKLLGIRNLTWEQVKAGGISQDKVASVKYANGGAGGGLISEPQRKRLYALCKKGNKTDECVKAYLLKAYKYTSSKEIERKVYDDICQWAEIPE